MLMIGNDHLSNCTRIVSVICLTMMTAAAAPAQATVRYVNAARPDDSGNGLTWLAAKRTLQAALANALSGDEIWVALGTYKPDQGGGQTRGDRLATFQLLDGVGIYGGFAGTETLRSQRNPSVNPTILSGDLIGGDDPAGMSDCCIPHQYSSGCDDAACEALVCASDLSCCTDPYWFQCVELAENLCGSLCTYDDNSYHVVSGSFVDETAVLDGFTVMGGRADSDAVPNHGGGGILIWVGGPTISNCTFRENSGGNAGAALVMDGSPNFSECAFLHNQATFDGGAVQDLSVGSIFLNCEFRNNRATNGGAMEVQNAVTTLVNCQIQGNTASSGGGIFSVFDANVTLVNTVFIGNTSNGGGGALIQLANGAATLSNCTLYANSADAGGGIYSQESPLSITNCIFWQNSDGSGTGEASQIFGLAPVINYSLVQGLTGGWGGTGNFDADPLFVDADGADNTPGTEDDNAHLTICSPAVDSGTNSPPGGLSSLDLEGNVRVFNAIVDLGAYEVQAACPTGACCLAGPNCLQNKTSVKCFLQDGIYQGDNTTVCTTCPICGNSIVEPGEECDPPDGVTCNPMCRFSFCGDGFVEGNEECDPPDGVSCDGSCHWVCGDGIVQSGEECDPPDGMSCDANCQINQVSCGPGQGDCCDPHLNPGCENITCCNAVCAIDPHCCNTAWDSICVDEALQNCAPGTCVDLAPEIVWDPTTNPGPWPNANPEATTRALRFKVIPPAYSVATGAYGTSAIKMTMVDLQHPDPRNLPQYPPANFSMFDTETHGTCAGATTSPNYNGHHCATDADCLGSNGAIATDDGTCSAGPACTAIGEANPPTVNGIGGCARWVGKPGTFYESQGPPQTGPYRASRLQCVPVYWDWIAETATGPITVVGAEIVPSSEYRVEVYGSSCKGNENTCTSVSTPVTMYTRRKGDLDGPYQGPSPAPLTQADVLDISQAVASVKHTGPAHYRGQMQPNLPELNADVNVLDIVEAVDSVKRTPYSFSGPCVCPSTVTCGGSCTGCTGLCLKTCVGGDNDGETCVNNTHCPGVCSGGTNPGAVCPSGVPGGANCVGTCVGGGNPGAACTNPGTQCTGGGVCSGQCSGACGAVGTCYDKCGRCSP